MRTVETRTREEQLLEYIRTQGTVRVDALSRELGVGASTVRRDLHRLAADGRILRTYGGAAVSDGASKPPAATATDDAKGRIGAAALELVHDGDTIVISSGSTAFEFARRLARAPLRDVTVITNALDVAQLLVDRPGIQVVVLGGVARPGMRSLLGHLTELACRELQADIMFMGVGAISADVGVMNDYMPEVVTDRAIRAMASRLVVLADGSKFGTTSPAIVIQLADVNTIVTDASAPSDVVDRLRGRGVEVIVASAGEATS
jgi:DeoR/GlpR family transcriptional regulator of sugar metabolism